MRDNALVDKTIAFAVRIISSQVRFPTPHLKTASIL